jgi:multiple antibiotic resistance protein
MVDLSAYIKFLVSLLAIVNPIGAIPIFISLSDGYTPRHRAKIAKITALSVTVILLVCLAFGEIILAFFGITIGSFRIGGGILLLLMAISMLQAKTSRAVHTADEAEETADKGSIAVVPLAIPLLAGPGAISTVIVYAYKVQTIHQYAIGGMSIIIVGTSVFLALLAAPHISSRLGRTGINIVTRIMGLILAAIAVEFITNGIKNLFPMLS